MITNFHGIKLVDAPKFVYRGGKGRIRSFISRWIPKTGNVYCEPFAGRANVFFLVSLFCEYNKYILNDNQTIPFLKSIKEYDGRPIPTLSIDEINKLDKDDPLLLLMEPIITWAGGLKEFTTFIGSRQHDVENYRTNLLNAKKLLNHYDVSLQTNDAINLLENYDFDNNSFVYLDPPYLSGKVGSYLPDSFDRKRMIELLQDAKYKWILSEYECDDLNAVFGRPKVFQYNIPVMPSGNKVIYKTEVLYTNIDISKGPNRLNFGHSEKPMPTSCNIIQDMPSITKEEFISKVPVHWTKRTANIQFGRLCTLPYTYFDGTKLYNLDLINKWYPNIY